MKFEKYPFEKLNELLKHITPNSDFSEVNLTIGEPQFDTPKPIQEVLKNNTTLLNKYPKSAGEDYLKQAQINFFKQRFNISLNLDQIIPTFGTREVLFNFGQFYLFDKTNPTVAFTNPFYQIYEGSAIASRANIIYINLDKSNNFEASLDEKILKNINLVILNYPNNPTGATISKNKLSWWINKAIEYDFCLINDECYSEIYIKNKPLSLLEVCKEIGNDDFKNCLVVNSLSKRNSAPGLRSGFIAGDSSILNSYKKYRTYLGCAIPLPLQKAAAFAWEDFESAKNFKDKYAKNKLLAKEILDIDITDATFYIWLEVGDDLAFTKELFQRYNIKVLPGRFLGREGVGEGFVRIALINEPSFTKEVLQKLKQFIKEFSSEV